MLRMVKAAVMLTVVLGAFALGAVGAHYRNYLELLSWALPVESQVENEKTIRPETPVVKEYAYTKCRHMVVNRLKAGNLAGKTLAEIRKMYPSSQGYLVWISRDGKLIIHKRIEDWCPTDRHRVHLGINKGYVAVFRGPGGINDEVLRTTLIQADSLPEQMRRSIEAGVLEFDSEDEAYFVLENLDEYD